MIILVGGYFVSGLPSLIQASGRTRLPPNSCFILFLHGMVVDILRPRDISYLEVASFDESYT